MAFCCQQRLKDKIASFKMSNVKSWRVHPKTHLRRKPIQKIFVNDKMFREAVELVVCVKKPRVKLVCCCFNLKIQELSWISRSWELAKESHGYELILNWRIALKCLGSLAQFVKIELRKTLRSMQHFKGLVPILRRNKKILLTPLKLGKG